MSFESCIATTSGCAHEMLKYFHGAPYAVCVELKKFYIFVFCFGGLLWRESGRVGCIRSRV